MFPIRDHNPSSRTPFVVYTLMAINILVFVSTLDLRSDTGTLMEHYRAFALFPAQITHGSEFHTLVTSTFLHGGFMHLAGNMLFLWIFGDNLEDQMGHGGFLLFYMLCGIGASLVQVMSNPDSTIPVIGASGAIAGVMGGYMLLFPKAKIDILLILIVFFRIFSVPAWVVLGFWTVMQVLGGLGANPETGGVAYWAHFGGFMIGVVLAVPLWLSLGGSDFWRRTHGHAPNAEAARTLWRSGHQRADRGYGYGSLNPPQISQSQSKQTARVPAPSMSQDWHEVPPPIHAQTAQSTVPSAGRTRAALRKQYWSKEKTNQAASKSESGPIKTVTSGLPRIARRAQDQRGTTRLGSPWQKNRK